MWCSYRFQFNCCHSILYRVCLRRCKVYSAIYCRPLHSVALHLLNVLQCICEIVKQSGHQTHLSYSNEAICLLNAHCRTLQMNCMHAMFGNRFRVIYSIPLKLYISSYMSYLQCSFSALKFKYRDYQHQFRR